jgi:hypothetical protein
MEQTTLDVLAQKGIAVDSFTGGAVRDKVEQLLARFPTRG